MSEFQYIAFRAIDGPVSMKNLQFMRKQSSRAKITAWTFDNVYDFGDFHGDAQEMLRRGYDFHFHYANFGVRTLMIRLPNGLPDPKAAEAYFENDSLSFLKDKQGRGGILRIQPAFEPGDLDEIWEPQDILDRLLPLRAEILDGDLRPLYLARVAVASDMNHDPDEEKDAPVPAGLTKLTRAQSAMAELYGLSDALIAAAAQNSPSLSKHGDSAKPYAAWLRGQPEAIKIAWLSELMEDPQATVRSEMLTEYQKNHPGPVWPTVRVDRTLAQLKEMADGIQHEKDHKSAEAAARKRARRLAGMAADPQPTLRETQELVKKRNTDAYRQVAALLADLREALSGTDQSGLPEAHARKLKANHPTLHHLTSELQKKGFLKK